MVEVTKGTITKVRDDLYNLDFGNVLKGSDISSEVSINIDKKAIKVSSSCGCTTPTVNKDKTPIELTIKYNNQRLGKIAQNVTVLLENGKQIKINVLGYVS